MRLAAPFFFPGFPGEIWGRVASILLARGGDRLPARTVSIDEVFSKWLHTFSPTDFGSNPGCDFDPVAIASQTVGDSGFYTWNSTPALVDDVQSWVDNPSGNFGGALVGDESGSVSAKRFDSRENPTVANRPSLTVNFTAIPEPTTGVFWSLCSIVALGVRRRRG